MRALIAAVLPTILAIGLFISMQISTPSTALAGAPADLKTVSGPVMTECQSCHGSDWCHHCDGTGLHNGNLDQNCHGCGGTGSCQDCAPPHPLVLLPGGKR